MTSASSAKFKQLIKCFDEKQVYYFVAWGFENLPEQHSGGDVDIYVHPYCFRQSLEIVEKLGYSVRKCEHYNDDHLHVYCGLEDGFSVELFNGLCFNIGGETFYTVFDPGSLGFQRKGALNISSSTVECLFSLLRFFAGRKDPQIVDRIIKNLKRVIKIED